jgi:hypothetical protein
LGQLRLRGIQARLRAASAVLRRSRTTHEASSLVLCIALIGKESWTG